MQHAEQQRAEAAEGVADALHEAWNAWVKNCERPTPAFAGLCSEVRRLSIAGSVLFAIAIVTLLWQTIGTLLDQSLFFLVGGAALIAIASGMRRLLAKFSKPVEAAP